MIVGRCVPAGLCRLDVVGCPGISDEGLAQLTALPSLKRLVVSNCHHVTDEVREHLVRTTCTSPVPSTWSAGSCGLGCSEMVWESQGAGEFS